MPAPTLLDYAESPWDDDSITEATTDLDWSASGDVIVVLGMTEDNARTMNTPTATGLTFSALSGTPTATGSSCKGYGWSATAVGNNNSVINQNNGDAWNRGLSAWAFSGSAGIGTPVVDVSTGTTTSVTVAQDSSVVMAFGDWAATADVTVATTTPVGGTIRQISNTANYTSLVVEWHNQTAGTRSYGVTDWTGTGTVTKIAVEVTGSAGSDAYQAPRRVFVGPYPRLLRSGVLAPLQLMGDRTSPSGDASVSLTDTAVGDDALTVTAAAPLADTAAATDALAVAAAVPLTDTAGGDDVLSVATLADPYQVTPLPFPPFAAPFIEPHAVPLQLQGDASGSASVAVGDTGTGDDAATVTAAVPLADTASGTDALAGVAAVPLADTAAATDSVTVAVAVPLAETATGDDSLGVSVSGEPDSYQAGPQVAWMFTAPNAASLQLRGDAAQAASADQAISLSDTAAGTDALGVAAAVPLSDTAAGTDALSVVAAAPLTDTAAGTDALSVTAAVPLDDTITAADTLTAQDSSAPDPYQAAKLPFPAFAAPFIEPHTRPLQLQGEDNSGQSLTVADTATATDSLSISVSVVLTDTAAGTDALSAAVVVPLSELVAASDALALVTVLALSETATGADLLSVNTGGEIHGNAYGHGPRSSPGNVYPYSSGSIIGSVG